MSMLTRPESACSILIQAKLRISAYCLARMLRTSCRCKFALHCMYKYRWRATGVNRRMSLIKSRPLISAIHLLAPKANDQDTYNASMHRQAFSGNLRIFWRSFSVTNRETDQMFSEYLCLTTTEHRWQQNNVASACAVFRSSFTPTTGLKD